MDRFIIEGPTVLKGSVDVSAAKNACLPILIATILNPNPIKIEGLPKLRDINTTLKLLKGLGVKVNDLGNDVELNAKNLESFIADYDLVRTMRASILVLGPLLARCKSAKVSLPGGCAIGTRPIDIHLMGLEKMGAKINLTAGYIEATTDGLTGSHIVLPFPSVGATEHLMMAATLANGITKINNAAREPEIEDLANFLNKMGAMISGAGSDEIIIAGVKEFKPISYRPIGDRIEAATFIMCGLITNSEIVVQGFNPDHLKTVLDTLTQIGADLEIMENSVRVKKSKELKGITIDTAPYPGFPTDVQAQMMALAINSSSSSMVTEHIFENRFMHVSELQRLGANIIHRGNVAMIEGKSKLNGAPVMCTDLRASAALVLAALSASGVTEVQRVYHIDRGYEKIDIKLQKLGAKITRVNRGGD